MNLLNQLQTRLFKTSPVQGFIKAYTESTGSRIIRPEDLQTVVKQEAEKTAKSIADAAIKTEIEKVELMRKNDAMRYRVPLNFNSNTDPDRKPGADVPFSFLRRMAVLYPIARACINRRIRQLTQLEWDIAPIDELTENGQVGNKYDKDIKAVKDFFKQPMGHKTRLRELLTIIIDDILTLDAITFEIQRTRGGGFLHLIPVDPTTIVLKVTETGATPEPPEAAYAQFIQGHKIAEFTTDEMVYESMGNRSYSPYGMSPLESLILQCEAALRGTIYNLNYFRESNVPEGFVTLPEEVATTRDQVEEWQMWFDALVSGDPKFQRRLKILPGGAEYTAAKKPEDMAFERFELWLLQQTCAVFDVPPQDIGITYQVNKATSETQEGLSRERGLYPLANFIKEIMDDIVQVEMEMPHLQWSWKNLNPVDRTEEVEIAEKEIDMGALSVDEYRMQQGKKPLGIKQYIRMGNSIVMVDDIVSGKYSKQQEQIAGKGQNSGADDEENDGSSDKKKKDPEEESEKMQMADLKRWRKCIYKDLELGKPLRKRFPSEFIDADVHAAIEKGLEGVHSKMQAKLLFDEFIDPEIKSAVTLLKISRHMRQIQDATLTSDDNEN